MYRLFVVSRAVFVGAVGRISDDDFMLVDLIAPVRQVFMANPVGEELIKVAFVIIILHGGSVTPGLV